MSQGLCTSCGAAVNLAAGQDEINCTYCGTLVTRPQAEAQFAEVKNSKFGGTLLIAETAQEGGSYAEAINYFNKVIEQEPTFADAWLNKGICMVKTSKIGDLKIPEAISSWKAAIKFAKNPVAMKKRVATEINNVVSDFYPVLENHYLRFHNVENSLSEHGDRFLVLESALSLALELSPTAAIAKNGISLCDAFVASIKKAAGSDSSKVNVASDLEKTLQVTKDKYEQVLAKIDPEAAALAALGINEDIAKMIFSDSDGFPKAAENIQKLRRCKWFEAVEIYNKAAKELGAKYPGKYGSYQPQPKSGCFVATACYGDYDHPIVMELRHFRDNCLAASTAGRAFVRWYYQWSPAFASFVAKNGILKVFARILIVTPAVAVVRMMNKIERPARSNE